MRQDPRDAALEADEAERFGGQVQARGTRKARRGAAVYLVTSAQNNTHIHKGFWRNLMAYAARRRAQVLVSQFTYNKGAYLKREGLVKPGSERCSDFDELWYDPLVKPYICNERVQLAPGLVFCGEANIMPTASRPISGFENFTGRSSTILPHARQEMQSIASLGDPKLIYTTGTATLRNYLQKRVGLVAEHFHAYGALVVEVDRRGRWWVRQLRADENGDFYDCPGEVLKMQGGKITGGHRVESISYGDIHVEQLDPVVRAITWGAGGITDTLRPRYHFFHDVNDSYARNHHEMKNPHAMFKRFRNGQDSVEAELRRVAAFLAEEAFRPWAYSVVVDSNHDQALMRWLRDSEFRTDPVNAQFYLRAQQMVYRNLAAGRDGNVMAAILRQLGVPSAVKFLDTDESFVVCKRFGGGIEHSQHGHTGINGARGTPRGFEKLGRRMTTGHTHSAGISGDVFTGGTKSKLRMGYNSGPSSWSHSDVIAYPNGCRAILTIYDGAWHG